MTTEVKIVNVGSWTKVQIVKVEFGFERFLQNGKWVNITAEPQKFETELLTIEHCFFDYTAAEKYVATNKAFKALLKLVTKNLLTFTK